MKRILLFILTLLILLAGTAYFFRYKIVKHFAPTVEQIGDIHIQADEDTSYISSQLSLENKTFLEIKIDSIRYKVGLFGKTYLKNRAFVGIVLPPYGKDTLKFNVKVPFKAVLKDLKTERKKNDSAEYAINVFLQFTTMFGKTEIPINKTAKLKIPQPPELEILDIKYKKFRLRSVMAEVKVKVTNHTKISLLIRNIDYDMNVPKEGNLKGSYKKSVILKPNGTTIAIIPIEIHVNSFGRTIMEVLTNNDKYKYTLTLNTLLESTDSLKRTYRVDLTKTGKIELRK